MTKILHINFSDSGGGAPIAMLRHHEAMVKYGLDSNVIVLTKTSKDDRTSQLFNPFKTKIITFFIKVTSKLFHRRYRFFASWSSNLIGLDISKRKEIKNADIIILHWVNNFFLSLDSIRKILLTGKPVYWFMHDMWPITGGCHHSFECDKYTKHCQCCIMMNQRSGSKINKDISYFQFKKKLDTLLPYDNLKFITPSYWLYNKVKNSAIARGHEIYVCRNILDTSKFYRKDKYKARKDLGLPLDKKLILFGAANLKDPYKGWNYLREALNMGFDDCYGVVFGSLNPECLKDINLDIRCMGRITNQDDLTALYSACDVFVSPSIADNYPNVLIEAMACGLVCVGFNTGGIPEIIKDGFNGFIAHQYDSHVLYETIRKALYNSNYEILSKNAESDIKQNNSYNNFIYFNKLQNTTKKMKFESRSL